MTVTERNTKKEIISQLKTTEQLLNEAQKELAEERKKFGNNTAAKLKTAHSKIVEKARSLNPDDIRNDRLEIIQHYSDIENKIRESMENLDTMQQAEAVMKENLKNLHGITAEADTLEALIRANAIEMERFQADRKELQTIWSNKINDLEQLYRDKEGDLEKNHKRKKEEWDYRFEKQVLVDNDRWEQESLERRRKLEETEREVQEKLKKAQDEMAAKVEEFNSYKAQVEAFPERLAAAVDEAKAKAAKRLEQSHHFKVEHLKKDAEIKTSILEQRVKDLTERLSDQTARNAELTSKLDSASEKVESIAKEAISGAAKQKVFLNTSTDKEK